MASFIRFPNRRNLRLAAGHNIPHGTNALRIMESMVLAVDAVSTETSNLLRRSISSGPISIPFVKADLGIIDANATLTWGAFTLTADATVRGNLVTASLTWGAFTLSAFTELETEANASLTWGAFTLEALAESETEAEVTAIWNAFTFQAEAVNPFRFVRVPNISGTIIRPLDGLPTTIITAGSITRETQVIS